MTDHRQAKILEYYFVGAHGPAYHEIVLDSDTERRYLGRVWSPDNLMAEADAAIRGAGYRRVSEWVKGGWDYTARIERAAMDEPRP